MGWTPNRSEWNQTPTRQIGNKNKNKQTKKREGAKIFPGSVTILINVYRKPISADRYTPNTQNEWDWTEEHTKAFNNLKKLITHLSCLANNKNILTTHVCTKGLGATLWQKQKDGNSKPIGFANRFYQTPKISMQ